MVKFDNIGKKCYNFGSLVELDIKRGRRFYEKFVCNDCKISFVNDEWDIPGELQATEAQIKACNFVSRELGYEPPPPTKRAMWKFLHETLEEAQDSKEKRWMDSWDGYDYPIPEEDCY